MAEQQLVDYIKKAKAAGQSDQQSRVLLAKNGWTENEINDAFAAAFPDYNQPQARVAQVSGQPRVDVKTQAAQTPPRESPQTEFKPKPDIEVQNIETQNIEIQKQPQPAFQPQPSHETMPQIRRKSHLLLKLIFVLIIIFALAGTGLYSANKFLGVNILSYFNLTFPWNPFAEKPETVIEKMAANMANVKTSRASAQIKLSAETGGPEQFSLNFNINNSSDTTNPQGPKSETSVSLAFLPEGENFPAASASVNQITIGRDIYVKLNDVVLPADILFMPELFEDGIPQLKGKFLKIDQESVDALMNISAAVAVIPDISLEEQSLLGNKIRSIFSADIFTVSQKLPDAVVSGQATHHYMLMLPKAKVKSILNGLISRGMEQFPIEETLPLGLESFMNPITDAIGDINVEVWIGKSDYLLYKLKFDKIFDLSKTTAPYSKIEVKVDLTFSDYNKPVSIQAPQEFQRIEDVLLPLLAEGQIAEGVVLISYDARRIFQRDSSYSSLCNRGLLNGYDPTYGDYLITYNNDIIANGGSKPACFASSQNYCVSTQLPSGGFACAGKGGIGNKKCNSAQTACP